jgi:cytochrome c556
MINRKEKKMKAFKISFLSVLLLVLGGGLIWGNGVVPTDMNSPKDIVQARKALMMAIKTNMDDAAQKLKQGNVKDIQANARAVDVMARLIPPLYRDTYKEVYTGEGNFFKGAPAAEIQAIAAKLSAAAQVLQNAAAGENKGAAQAGIGKVYQSCGLCHKPYRGKF